MACTRQLITWLASVVVVLASLIAPGAIATASAQSCSSLAEQCSEGQAYAVCRSELASYIAGRAPVKFRNDRCEKTFPTSTNSITSKFEYQNGTTWIGGVHRNYYYTRGCSTEPAYTGVGPWSSGGAAKNGSLGCRNGCDGVWSRNADSSMTWSPTGGMCPENEKSNCANMPDGYYWNAILKVCEPPEGNCPGGAEPNSLGQCAPEPCPSGMIQQADGTCKKKDNECPAGQVKSPDGKCLPGEGQCAQGEARGKDGTCKRDGNNNGKPDEEEEGGQPGEGEGEKIKEEFSGGDDCSRPPSCSGSPIMCGQARIQWRIDCNTRKNRNIAGGMCSSPPICTGDKCDALEYTGLLMQWRTACAVENLAGQGSANGQPEWTKVGGMSTDPGAGSSPDDTKVLTTKVISMNDLDQSGIGGGGTCPGFAAGGVQGVLGGLNDSLAAPPAFFCNYMGHIKALLIILAAVGSAFILARGSQ